MLNNRYIAFALSLFLILICLYFDPYLKNGFTLPKELLLYGLATSLVSLAIASLVVQGRLSISLRSGMIPLSLITMLVLLSLAYTPSMHAATDEVLIWISYCVIFFFAAQLPPSQISRLILCSLAAGALMGGIAILQYFNIDPLPLHGGQFKIYSTLGNPNYVGGYLAVVIPASLGLIIFHGLKGKKILLLACIALSLCVLAVVYSHSRGAMISSGLSILILLGVASSRRIKSTKWILIALLLLVIIAVIINMGVKRIDERTGRTSAQWRLFTWRAMVEMIKERPILGWGAGSLNLVYLEYQANLLDNVDDLTAKTSASGVLKRAHNEYLQLAAEEGLAAPILFTIFIFICTRAAFKGEPITYGLGASMISFAILSLTNFPLRLPAIGYPFFVFAGLSLSSQKSIEVKLEARGLLRRGVWLIAAILIMAQAAYYCCEKIVSEVSFTQGFYCYNNNMPAQALEYFRKALKWTPNDGITRLYSGICLSQLKRREEAKKAILDSLETYCEMYSFLELGNLYAVTREYEKAIYLLQLCTRIVPMDPQPHFSLAYAYYAKGDYQRAIEQYKEVISLDPDYPEAKRNLALSIQSYEKAQKIKHLY